MNKERVVLIIGGSGGIGSHLVDCFIKSQYKVAFTYNLNKSEADILSKEGARGYKVNVKSEDEVARLKNSIQDDFGRLDALIYATGVFEDSLVENCSLDSWNNVIEINLTGAFLVTKHFLDLLRESGHGRILYTGSVMGEAGTYGSSSYSVTKAGLVALAKSVGLENAKRNVTANVVAFGYIDVGMTGRVPDKVLESAVKKIPMKRLGDPDDTAQIVVDLCSDHMNYISGQVIRINGMLYV